jgi:TolB-like protein
MSECVDESSDVGVRTELQRILKSSNFTASDRNRRFLEYVVEESLAGRAGRLKAYNIATSVFGRPDSFDPQIDPVVRMEAGRLRRALERFYLLDGQACDMTIAMPKGGYVPQFKPVGSQSEVAEYPEATNGRNGPVTILVALFDPEGDPSATLNLNIGFTRQLMICLHQMGECVVCRARSSAGSATGFARDPRAANSDLILVGDLAVVGQLLNVTALLLEAPEGRVRWGNTFQREIARDQNIFAVRDAVAECVAKSLHDHLHKGVAHPRAGRSATLSQSKWEGHMETDFDDRAATGPLVAPLHYRRPVPTH